MPCGRSCSFVNYSTSFGAVQRISVSPGASFLRNADNQTQHAELRRSMRLSLIAPFDSAQDATFVPNIEAVFPKTMLLASRELLSLPIQGDTFPSAELN